MEPGTANVMLHAPLPNVIYPPHGLHTHAQKQRLSVCTASQPSGEEREMSVLERVDRGWNPTPTVDKAL